MNKKDLSRAAIYSASKVVILSPGISEISTFKTSQKNEKEEDNNSSSARGLTREEENL